MASSSDIDYKSLKIGIIGYSFKAVSDKEKFVPSLIRSGYTVMIYFCDQKEIVPDIPSGYLLADTPAKLINFADIIFSCVKDEETLNKILFNEENRSDCILEALVKCGKDKIGYVEMTLLSEDFVNDLDFKINSTGCPFMYAPLSTFSPAGSGKLEIQIMAAGNKKLFEQSKHFYQVGSIDCVYLTNKSADAVNINCSYHMFKGIMNCALAEMLQAWKDNDNTILERNPEAKTYTKSFIDAFKKTGFSTPLLVNMAERNLEKDYTNNSSLDYVKNWMKEGVIMASENNIPLPLGNAATRMFKIASDRGLGSSDEVAVSEVNKKLIPDKKPNNENQKSDEMNINEEKNS